MPRSPLVCFVVAAAENGVIGRDGRLPWRMPSDMRLFRRLTLGKPVIMGRRTFQSLKKPLECRDNIVVTRAGLAAADAVHVAASPGEALQLATRLAADRGCGEIMVIGGAEIYRSMLPAADRIYLTRIHATPEGDTVFPEPDGGDWTDVSREAIARDPRDEYGATLVVLERRLRDGSSAP